jgi:large subunit ribosomal protein L17
MRHKNAGRKFSRTPAHRKAMFKNLLTNLFLHEKIRTTDAKAKELRRLADRLITMGKDGKLASIRHAALFINDAEVLSKLFKTIAPRFADRNGGYTRVVKIGQRRGDGAEMSLVELLDAEKAAAPEKGKKQGKAKAAPKKGAEGAKKAPAKKAEKAEPAAEAPAAAPAEPKAGEPKAE